LHSDAVLADRCKRSLESSRLRRAQAAVARVRHRRRVVMPRAGVSLLVLASIAIASIGTTFAVAESNRSSSSASYERGDRGATVKAIQRRLGVPADGVFGPATKRAVKRFQRRHGLTIDGVVGPQTLAAMGIRGTPARSRGGTSSVLERIARCESGGNPRAVSPDGRYRGKYQFSRATWRSLGGEGDPARASEAEQDRLAAKLYRQRGTAPWPSCA
jgi:resuscitation-promoting factor RpfB